MELNLEKRKNLGDEKLEFTITAKGLQDLLGAIEFNIEENEFQWLDPNGKYIYKQMCDLFKETDLYKESKKEWLEINKRFKENERNKKVISIEALHAKRFSDKFCEKYDHLI